MSGPEPVGQRPEVAFRFQEPLDALGIRVADVRQQRLLACEAFEPPFNASQLAPVKFTSNQTGWKQAPTSTEARQRQSAAICQWNNRLMLGARLSSPRWW